MLVSLPDLSLEMPLCKSSIVSNLLSSFPIECLLESSAHIIYMYDCIDIAKTRVEDFWKENGMSDLLVIHWLSDTM